MNGLDLKIARIRANLKQWELASKLSITQNQLSQYELGRKPIPYTVAQKVRGELGLNDEQPKHG